MVVVAADRGERRFGRAMGTTGLMPPSNPAGDVRDDLGAPVGESANGGRPAWMDKARGCVAAMA